MSLRHFTCDTCCFKQRVEALEFLIASVLFKKPREVPKQTEQTEAEHPEHVAENSTVADKTTKKKRKNRNNLK